MGNPEGKLPPDRVLLINTLRAIADQLEDPDNWHQITQGTVQVKQGAFTFWQFSLPQLENYQQ